MLQMDTSRWNSQPYETPLQGRTRRPLALYTESVITLLSPEDPHHGFQDLLALMGQTFPLAAPMLALRDAEGEGGVYTVVCDDEEGLREARRLLKSDENGYCQVAAGGQPPLMQQRVDLPLVMESSLLAMLSINAGMHEEIFRGWVKILAPAIKKLMDAEQLKRLAFRDGLTGALNYRALEEMLHREMERAQRYNTPFALIMLDVDYFKKINDTYGHLAGDLALKSLTDVLNATLRQSDMVFRYGGEEFVVLLPHADLDTGRRLAERIREAVAKMPLASGVKITVSLGVSEYVAGMDGRMLISRADRGLYLAKERGRNRTEIIGD